MRKTGFLTTLALCLCMALPACGEPVQIWHRGDETKSRIAITVDDCYGIPIMEDMLALFLEQGVHVTFYPVGAAIKEKDQALWQRVLDEGHEIGNHSYGHKNLAKHPRRTVMDELVWMQKKLNAVLGYEYPIRTMRPPYGSFESGEAFTGIAMAGYHDIVMWSCNQQNPALAAKQIKNGSICLFHTNRLDLKCLTELIPLLKEKGFEMVTISELLELNAEGDETVENAGDDSGL